MRGRLRACVVVAAGSVDGGAQRGPPASESKARPRARWPGARASGAQNDGEAKEAPTGRDPRRRAEPHVHESCLIGRRQEADGPGVRPAREAAELQVELNRDDVQTVVQPNLGPRPPARHGAPARIHRKCHLDAVDGAEVIEAATEERCRLLELAVSRQALSDDCERLGEHADIIGHECSGEDPEGRLWQQAVR